MSSSKQVECSYKRRSEDLIVQGSGYTPPLRHHLTTRRQPTKMTQPASTSSMPATRASSRSTTIAQKRPPFISACGGGSSTLKRYGSVGNIPAANPTAATTTTNTTTVSKARIPFQLPQSNSGFLRRQELHQEKINARRGSYGGGEVEVNCKCQHPADVSFLQDVYVQNLQTQIEVLELENSYLRGNHSSTAGTAIPPKSILKEELGNGAFRQCHMLEPHPPPPQQHRPHRVQFIGEPSSRETSEGRSHSMMQFNGGQLNGGQLSESFMSRLDEAHRIQLSLETKLKSQLGENRELLLSKEQLEDRLVSVEERVGEERRALMKDTVEMQRRLDELTPLLAAKEARIAKLENERDASVDQLKKSSLEIHRLRARLEERKREESLVSELDSDRRVELKQLKEQIQILNRQLESRRVGASELAEEVVSLQAKLAESETLRKIEKDDEDRRRNELNNDNKQLHHQIKRLEAEMNQYYAERASRRVEDESERVATAQLRKREKSLERELTRCEELLQRERSTVETLTQQLRDRETKYRGDRDARLTGIHTELEGLKALSHSLTEENKGLREEKIAFEEKLAQVWRRLTSRDDEIRALARELEEFKRWHQGAQKQLQELEVTHGEELDFSDKELARIVQRYDRLLEFVPRGSMPGNNESVYLLRGDTTALTIVDKRRHTNHTEPHSSGWKQPSGHFNKEGNCKNGTELHEKSEWSQSSPSGSRRIDESASNMLSKEAGNGEKEDDAGELADESELAELRFRKFRRKRS